MTLMAIRLYVDVDLFTYVTPFINDSLLSSAIETLVKAVIFRKQNFHMRKTPHLYIFSI